MKKANHRIITTHTCLKQNNRQLKNYIISVIQEKNLQASLVKVKAHTGIRFNDLVDKLAKDGAGNLNLFLDLNLPAINTFSSFSSYFDNNFIDFNYRKFFMLILKSFDNEQ